MTPARSVAVISLMNLRLRRKTPVIFTDASCAGKNRRLAGSEKPISRRAQSNEDVPTSPPYRVELIRLVGVRNPLGPPVWSSIQPAQLLANFLGEAHFDLLQEHLAEAGDDIRGACLGADVEQRAPFQMRRPQHAAG